MMLHIRKLLPPATTEQSKRNGNQQLFFTAACIQEQNASTVYVIVAHQLEAISLQPIFSGQVSELYWVLANQEIRVKAAFIHRPAINLIDLLQSM